MLIELPDSFFFHANNVSHSGHLWIILITMILQSTPHGFQSSHCYKAGHMLSHGHKAGHINPIAVTQTLLQVLIPWLLSHSCKARYLIPWHSCNAGYLIKWHSCKAGYLIPWLLSHSCKARYLVPWLLSHSCKARYLVPWATWPSTSILIP